MQATTQNFPPMHINRAYKPALNLASVHHRKKSAKIFLFEFFLKQKLPNGGFRKLRLLRLRPGSARTIAWYMHVIQLNIPSAVFNIYINGLREWKNRSFNFSFIITLIYKKLIFNIVWKWNIEVSEIIFLALRKNHIRVMIFLIYGSNPFQRAIERPLTPSVSLGIYASPCSKSCPNPTVYCIISS